FLVPLDGERRWYRYHHLFADLLRARLRRIEPGLAPDLHRRASRWYEAHGFAQEAIHHALMARDVDSATRLIETHGMTAFYLGQMQTILEWFKALPAGSASGRPLLSVIHAYALYGTNQLEAAEEHVLAAESSLRSDQPPVDAGVVRGNLAPLRALIAPIRGDL